MTYQLDGVRIGDSSQLGGSETSRLALEAADAMSNVRKDQDSPPKREPEEIHFTDPYTWDKGLDGTQQTTERADNPSVKLTESNKQYWNALTREWLGLPNNASADDVARASNDYPKNSSYERAVDEVLSNPVYAQQIRDNLGLPKDSTQEDVRTAFENQRVRHAKEMGLPENASQKLMDDIATYADQTNTAQQLGLPKLDLRDVDKRHGSRDLALAGRDNEINQALQFAALSISAEPLKLRK